VTENKYEINLLRILIVLSYPLIFVTLILLFLILKYQSTQELSYETSTITAILLFLCLVPFFILFINHIIYANKTKLIISNKIIIIIQDGEKNVYDLSDIKKVIEYSTRRFPWSTIVKWELITIDKTYKISSLTISKLNFGRYFYNKIDYQIKVFPFL